MSTLHHAVADYLRIRRALGYKLERHGRLLPQFADYLSEVGASTITTEHALAWAMQPGGDKTRWWGDRLSIVRGFASWLATIDPTVEVPQPTCCRTDHSGPRRMCIPRPTLRRCCAPATPFARRCGLRPIAR